MALHTIDWIIIGAYLLLSLAIGLYYKNRAGKSLSDFFLSGRNLPWYVAGVSMVATTFAADTPLAVTELVANNGISGNWLWWNMLIGGMLTVFFFARLWRKANVLTEPELIELRYGGKPARFLRGFKAIYLGIFINTAIIGWVNYALITILHVFFDIPKAELIWYVAGIMSLTVLYSMLSGLWGVAITDFVQFFIAMTGCIVLAVIVVSSDSIGGIDGLKAKLPAGSLEFFPLVGTQKSVGDIAGTLVITVGAFLAFVGVQWWASWYPGAEPGGGGYVAQRMMSCKNEKHAFGATLFFQIAHYCLRPWPWIIAGLASLVLYPSLAAENKGMGYVYLMKDFLPVGLKGLLLVAFLAAYMSTIATQVNWGASYLINDLYKRFIKPQDKIKSGNAEKHYVAASRWVTLLIMIVSLFVTTQITSISGVWSFIIECGAGLGLVLILRWYWWRINAWSEIVATIAPFIAFAFSFFVLEPALGKDFANNKGTFFITVGFTTIAWLLATLLTKPENTAVLKKFYLQVQPQGYWKPFQSTNTEKGIKMPYLFICWISAIIFTYGLLFSTGYLIFKEWQQFWIWLPVSIVAGMVLFISIKKTKIL